MVRVLSSCRSRASARRCDYFHRRKGSFPPEQVGQIVNELAADSPQLQIVIQRNDTRLNHYHPSAVYSRRFAGQSARVYLLGVF